MVRHLYPLVLAVCFPLPTEKAAPVGGNIDASLWKAGRIWTNELMRWCDSAFWFLPRRKLYDPLNSRLPPESHRKTNVTCLRFCREAKENRSPGNRFGLRFFFYIRIGSVSFNGSAPWIQDRPDHGAAFHTPVLRPIIFQNRRRGPCLFRIL